MDRLRVPHDLRYIFCKTLQYYLIAACIPTRIIWNFFSPSTYHRALSCIIFRQFVRHFHHSPGLYTFNQQTTIIDDGRWTHIQCANWLTFPLEYSWWGLICACNQSKNTNKLGRWDSEGQQRSMHSQVYFWTNLFFFL